MIDISHPEIRRFILVDTCLHSWAGHHAMYANSLCQAAKETGMDIRIAAPIDADQALASVLPLYPIFSAEKGAGGPRILLSVRHAWHFYRSLKRLCALDFSEPTIVYVDNASHHELLRWATFMSVIPSHSPIAWIFMLRRLCHDIETRQWKEGRLHYKMAFHLFAARHGRAISFVTDSERLQTQYQGLTKAPIHIVPIPHTLIPARHTPETKKDRLIFAFLGDARAEKGILELMEAVPLVHADPDGVDIHFIIQAHQASYRDERVTDAFERLRTNGDARIQLPDTALPQEQYYGIIDRADVILCPYEPSRYQTTSGPFTEALATGTPVIVSANTWMSDQLKQYGAGITCDKRSPGALAYAILQMKRQYSSMKRQAEETQGAWQAIHNPRNFMRTLMEIATA
ncbi:MAG: glycosyltransferase [Spartobacteria bacterium]|nr:glycosyltransferase [Spartobacteria bacterium]